MRWCGSILIVTLFAARWAQGRERLWRGWKRGRELKEGGAQKLTGRLEAATFITTFRKIFMRNEMNDALVLVPARLGQNADDSEYEELLPVS